MDTILRNALLYGALSAMVVIVGGSLFLWRPLSAIWIGRLQVFAAGAVFAILALELMPDLLIAHHSAAMSAFLFGLALTIGMKWLTGKLKKGKGALAKSWLTALIEAMVYAFIAGVLIGSGFVAGVREGLLLTAALTVALLAICLVSLPLIQQVGNSRQRVIFFLLGLTLLILTGAASGATLLWGRSEIDLDLLYAFGMAVILLWAFETLVEAREDESPIHTLFFFFIGTMLFMFLASWFGRAHADHPGAKQNRVGHYHSVPYRKDQWDIHTRIHPPPSTKRNWPLNREDWGIVIADKSRTAREGAPAIKESARPRVSAPRKSFLADRRY